MSGLTRTHRFILLLAAAGCLLTFQGRRTLTEHEVFAAEPAREMLAGAGWLLQPFAGEYRTKKPPGQSWLIAASLFVTQSHGEWAARLPSALAGVGLALVTASIAAWLGTSRVGLVAGLMTLTCVGVQQRARLAEADMALALCVALANAAAIGPLVGRVAPQAAGRRTNTPSRRPALLFWAAVVGGFMLKGPIVLGFTVLPAIVAWVVLRYVRVPRSGTPGRVFTAERHGLGYKTVAPEQDAGTPSAPRNADLTADPADALRRAVFWWPAVAAGVLLIVAWPTLALYEHPAALAQWEHEIVDRLRGGVGHGDEARRDPLLSYAWLLPQSALPWFPFALVGSVWAGRRGLLRRPAVVLLVCWAGCGVAMVSVIAFKVLHYVLPIVAPVLIAAAFGFDRLMTRWLRGRRRERRTAWARTTLAGWFGAAIVGWGGWNAVVVPSKDWGRHVKRFAERVDATLPAGATVYFYHADPDTSREDQTAWYLHRPLRQAKTVPTQRPAYVICGTDDLGPLLAAGSVMVLETADPVVARDGTDRNDRLLVRVD